MRGSGSGRVGGAGGCPTIGAGIVSPAGVELADEIVSAPDDHFTASPDRGVIVSARRARWWCWWLSNYPCWDCICRRCSRSCRHQLRPRRSFRCRSRLPCESYAASRARWWCWWLSKLSVPGLYLPPVFKNATCHQIRPRRSFHCRSRLPCDQSRPVGALVVLVAVQLSVLGLYLPPVLKEMHIFSAPDDHFTAGPHCRVMGSGSGRADQC